MRLRNVIINALDLFEFTRNSDKKLMVQVWFFQHPGSFKKENGKRWMCVDDFEEIFSDPEAIRRQRAEIQNVNRLFPPTDPAVVSRRKKREDNWQEEILNA